VRVCSGAGCLRVVEDNVRFCDECIPAVPVDDGIRNNVTSLPDRDAYRRLYGGARWRYETQPKVLRRDPYCKRCDKAVAVLVDHIIPAGIAIAQVQASGRYPLSPFAGFYLMSNLQGLCRSCHKFKTDEDKAHVGAWPSVLDVAPRKRVYGF
jgi:5-methylcytosine-specific restriction endonuclease McrA